MISSFSETHVRLLFFRSGKNTRASVYSCPDVQDTRLWKTVIKIIIVYWQYCKTSKT